VPDLQCRQALAAAVREAARAERREARERLCQDARRLGRFRRCILGGGSDRDAAEQWEGGEDEAKIEALKERISEQRKFVESSRQSLKCKRHLPPTEGAAAGVAAPAALSQEEIDDDIWEQRELFISKLAAANRDETELKEREQRLRAEREEHVKLSRAIEVEDRLGFGDFSMLNSRYQLLRLTSRSLQTTIYRAFDLVALRTVVVRVHSTDPKCADRAAWLRDVARDCEQLSRGVRHPNVVPLLDFFPHDGDSLATVWEHVGGDTLEAYLWRTGPMPEKEVRGCAVQLLGVLRHVEGRGLRLSGLELRPSKLEVRGGEVRVSGAALLGSLRRGTASGREARALARTSSALTETPPEACGASEALDEDDFLHDWTKVAARSAGCTLHEMLFNRAPDFAPGGAVQLPDAPKVTAECRDFLGRLLDRERRPTLQELSSEPFVSQRRR